jgi:hypothetical protein
MRRRIASLIMVASTAGLAIPAAAHAEPTSSSVKDAGKHFQRGVALYNETDYRAALVEFRRAYEVAPNAAVLYNIGQTYYQLQNYASALTTLERYLIESGATASHRREVEQTIETLRARVGKVLVTTNISDCEITIDDELVGRTPLGEPVLVSIGRRKVTAMHEGRPAETRFVDVAAGDTVKLALSLVDPDVRLAPSVAGAEDGAGGGSLITAGWVTTGVLAAGAITAGVYAYRASRDLRNLRSKYPISRTDLDARSSQVNTRSVIADILGAATLVTGGITLVFSLSRSRSSEVHVSVAPNGIQLAGTFR